MTLPMSMQERIRALDGRGVPGRQIARDLGLSRTTVAKYIGKVDYSPAPPQRSGGPGQYALAGFTGVIDQWLTEDERRPVKQRHTARRVFDRLREEEGYMGSYSPVQRYVKGYKEQTRTRGEGFAELVWAPGSAQVDFGQGDAIIAGIQQTVFLLLVTFPYSNMRLMQAYFGQTAECVTHGLRRVGEFMGGMPREFIFDNAISVGRRTGKEIMESALFGAFKAHYRTSARYCNPESGHEKGNVENAVGFTRRNFMVPLPVVNSIAELNEMLWEKCLRVAQDKHWRKDIPIIELFARDKQASLMLPGIGFDAVRYESRRADKRGHILIEGNTYAAGPAYHGRRVTVAIRHDRIDILDETAKVVVSFGRVFGRVAETIFEPASYLPLLRNKPGSWSNSPIRELVTDPLRDWLDTHPAQERRPIFAALDKTARITDFATATRAAEHLITRGDRVSVDAMTMLATRFHQGEPNEGKVVDLAVYDTYLTPTAIGHLR